MNRRPQTLRHWASRGDGPIQPVRIRPRSPLLWKVADINRLLCDDAPTIPSLPPDEPWNLAVRIASHTGETPDAVFRRHEYDNETLMQELADLEGR